MSEVKITAIVTNSVHGAGEKHAITLKGNKLVHHSKHIHYQGHVVEVETVPEGTLAAFWESAGRGAASRSYGTVNLAALRERITKLEAAIDAAKVRTIYYTCEDGTMRKEKIW